MTNLLVATAQGVVEGRRRHGVRSWRGMRYAAAPTGDRRFLPPQPPPHWSGVRQADRFGPGAPQRGLAPFGIPPSPERFHEDCLRLNVWSGDCEAPAGAGRPVLLWIHGGAFLIGSADLFDGSDLARSGEIVVVTLNYRLGVFGFVDFGAVLGDARLEGNAGLRDIIAALRWVRDNIRGFGGDPGRVTVAGQSAGSIAVSLLMQCEAARGLFHGAIMQSGASPLIHDRRVSRAVAAATLDRLGRHAASLEDLQAVDARHLLAAQAAVQRSLGGGIAAAPFFDGSLLPADAAAARESATAPVPLLAGFTREEIRLFELLPGGVLHRRRGQLERLIRSGLGAEAEAVLEAYPTHRAGTRDLASDLYMAMPTLHFAERHSRQAPTWLYRFDRAHPLLGAAHGLELLYLWQFHGRLAACLRGGREVGPRGHLAQRMRRHWTCFVRDGHPGADWQAYDEARRTTMLFDRADSLIDDPQGARRHAWAGRDVATGASTGLGEAVT